MNSHQKSLLDMFNDGPGFSAYGEYFTGKKVPNIPLTTLLGIDPDSLKPFSKEVLDSFSNDNNMQELKNGIRAYQQFQDILSLSLDIEGSDRELYNRHYCYYESLIYLRESAISWLEGNSLASMTLLRPFLELSVLHLYWFLHSEKTKYKDFYGWFLGNKDKPPFRNQLDYVFTNLPAKDVVEPKKVKHIKDVLYRLFQAFSSYNHTPQISESVVGIAEGNTNASALSFFYCLDSINLLLRQVINLYILAYPMCVAPVDKFKKWGYEGPVGLFFDINNSAILEEYLGEENYRKLHSHISKLEEVREITNWYQSFSDITDEEVEKQWKEYLQTYKIDSNTIDVQQRIAERRAELRTLGWQINYYNPENKNNNIPEEQFQRAQQQLRNW